MQRESAPELDGDVTSVAIDRPEPAGDPVGRLLHGPPTPVRRLQIRHWVGLAGLVAAIAAAAFLVPPMISAGEDTSTHLGPPSWPSWSRDTAGAPVRAPATVTATMSAPVAAATTTTKPATEKPATKKPATKKPATKPATASAAFQPVSLQAEDATLSQGADKVACATCSGGARVRYVGRVDAHITVQSPGVRKITIVYEVVGDRNLDISINGDVTVARLTVSGNDWATPKSSSVDVQIPAGSVDIGLYGGSGNAPDLDKITIS